MKPRVAFISTGGTIASKGANSLDLINYGLTGERLGAKEILALFPEAERDFEVIPVEFGRIASNDIGFVEWQELATVVDELPRAHLGLAGIVIAHGTASMEETAYFLHLTSRSALPVVLVGSQRPPTALSSDAGMNLVNAIRTAAAPEARGLGALVVMNDEIHSARNVTKASTLRLHAFSSPDVGILGHIDSDRLEILRRPTAAFPLERPFDICAVDTWPRVDICYAYAGCDGTAVRAFAAAGARGVVSAGFAPGVTSKLETDALCQALSEGIAVVQCSRVLAGRVPRSVRNSQRGFITAGNLNPQKSRILLSLALTATEDRDEIQRWFDVY